MGKLQLKGLFILKQSKWLEVCEGNHLLSFQPEQESGFSCLSLQSVGVTLCATPSSGVFLFPSLLQSPNSQG